MLQLFQRLRQRVLESPTLRRSLIASATLLTLSIIVLVGWLVSLDRNIAGRFKEKRFAPPVEFYSAPEFVRPGSQFPAAYFPNLFSRKNYRMRSFAKREPVLPGDYAVWTGEECRVFLADASPLPRATPDPSLDSELSTTDSNTAPSDASGGANQSDSFESIQRCVVFNNRESLQPSTSSSGEAAQTNERNAQLIALSAEGRVVATYDAETRQTIERASIEPELFAQYYGETPILRRVVPLGETPTLCLNALLAIEDSEFMEHPGVSVTGLLRAVFTTIRNVPTGRRAQGGSTITQQLVKNYFLTDERTLKRKLTEIAMAFLVERHASKDDILETYINLIYMGQNGPFQVRGFAAASEHYFGKPLSDLNLPECALVAAVLNGPGVYDPFRHPDRALKRRSLVLDRMAELSMAPEADVGQAKAAPLPAKPQRSLTEPAPYFVQAVRRELKAKGVDESEGLRVYTTLNLRAQEAAQQSVRAGLDRIEKNYPQIQKLKEKGKNLEAFLISADPKTGFVEALVGGRGFLATQFNRATDGRRQVGSVMKPFVYLSAFEGNQPDGQPYTPLSLLKDVATTHRFEGQSWTPKNYEGSYNGEVPLFWALKESLNAATVNIGMSIGLDNVIEMSHRVGVATKLPKLPSLTLGSLELAPMEVVQSYGTLANLGTKVPLSLLARVETLTGTELFRFEPTPESVVAPDTVATLVGVMKQTVVSGTARGVRAAGFLHPSAGKTGTTNDKKDAWFAGFTPLHVAIVWVGYDDNTSHNLTGGSGAVPIWTSYMKNFATSFPPEDFPWPETTERVVLQPDQFEAYGVPAKKNVTPEPIELIFKKGTAPAPPEEPLRPFGNPSSKIE